MENVIITGATGMIGSHVAKILIDNGINVTAIIRPMSEKISNLKDAHDISEQDGKGRLQLVECSIDELPSLRDKLGWEHDTFFHFVWEHTYGPGKYDASKQEANIKATIDAVHLAYESGCKTFVGCGSHDEFGIISGKLSDELPKDPISGYGIAKLAANRLSALECRNLGMRHCWGRVLSCYGPGDNDKTMVMSAVKTMLRGDKMQFTPAEQIWDYLYSEDCAKAFIAIAEKGIDQKSYTIGSGEQRLLREYIYAIRDAIDPNLEVGIGERDYGPNQVMLLSADINELTADTGFVPETSFEDGIRKTIESVRQSLENQDELTSI